MTDLKPPRLASGERETLLALLQYQRESLVRKVSGVDEAAAATSPVASGTTLAWLVAHVTRAEASWIEERFGAAAPPHAGLPEALPTIDEAVMTYREGWPRINAVVAGADLDDVCRGDEATPPVNLRWVLTHVLEETARHAGHADVLRELIDGATGR